MSIRNSLLAILGLGPCYGFQLKSEFERRTGGVWPVNVGQVYTTLARLERDGLARRRTGGEAGRERFEITDAGRTLVSEWFRSPAEIGSAQRDEFVMKTLVALTLPGVDVGALLEVQAQASRLDERPQGGHPPFSASLAHAAQHEQLAAQARWIELVRGRLATAPEPFGLSAELPRRGRPAKAARTAA